jgi:tetratricopeptide (TPR) repeat protein
MPVTRTRASPGWACGRSNSIDFEDLQWAESSMLDLLDLLAARTTAVPLLLLAITRPELLASRPDWGSAARQGVRLALESLRPADAHALAREELGAAASADRLEALIARAGGNPLFVIELAAAMGERAAAMSVPPTIHDVIAARLDNLPAGARTAALSAAVAGRSFMPAALHALHPDADVAADLAVLTERGLIVREPGEERFIFRHDLIREVAYGTLTRAARRRAHRTLAAFFEGEGAVETAERAALLAHHYQAAEEVEAAVRYLVLAAGHASRSWAGRQAAAFYEEAATLVPDDERRRTGLRLAGALALVDGGDYEAASEALEALSPTLDGAARVEALIGWSRARFWMMDTSAAQRVARDAVDHARTLGDRVLLARARAVQSLALSSLEGRTLQGIAEGEAVIASWPAAASAGDRATLLATLGGYHYWAGDFASAVRRAREGYELARELRRLDDLLLAASHLALGLTGFGLHEQALELCVAAAAEGREHEAIPRFTARLLNMWANVHRELGDVAASRQLNTEALELALRAGFPPPVVQARIDLLFCDLADGEFGRASTAWPALQEQAASMRAWHNWLTLGRLATAKAEIALGLGHPAGAAQAAAAALDHARRVHRPKHEAASLRVLGEAQLRLGDPAAALATQERCLQITASVAAAAATAGRHGTRVTLMTTCRRPSQHSTPHHLRSLQSGRGEPLEVHADRPVKCGPTLSHVRGDFRLCRVGR